MPLPVRRNIQFNTTDYINYDPKVAELVRQLQVALKFGREGPLSKAINKKIRGVKKPNHTKKKLVRVSPTNWTSQSNGTVVGEEFAYRNPQTGKLMSLSEFRKSALASGGLGVKQLKKKFENKGKKVNNTAKINKTKVRTHSGRLQANILERFKGPAPMNRSFRNKRGSGNSSVVLTIR